MQESPGIPLTQKANPLYVDPLPHVILSPHSHVIQRADWDDDKNVLESRFEVRIFVHSSRGMLCTLGRSGEALMMDICIGCEFEISTRLSTPLHISF